MVVGRAVVEIDVPAVVAAPAAVANDVRLHRVEEHHVLVGFPRPVVVQIETGQPPVAVAAPGIERAVVARLLDGVEDIAELDGVAAPAAVAEIDARPRHVVDRAVPDGDSLGHVQRDARRLLLHLADVVDQAVFHQAVAPGSWPVLGPGVRSILPRWLC